MTSLQFDKEKRKQKKTYATFIIAFLCFSILLAAVSFLILLKSVNFKLSNLVDRKTTVTTEDVSSESETALQSYSGSANVLAICSASGKKLDFFSVLFMDMNSKQISVLSCENDTAVNIDGKEMSFSKAYALGGAEGLLQAVEKYYNIKLDRYFDVTESNFKSIFSYLGDVVITSDEKINFRGENFVLILEEGEQSATGDTVLSYFKYLDASGRSRLFAQIIDYYIDNGKLTVEQATFDKLVNLVNTNISAKDFSLYSATADAFFKDSLRKKTVVADINSEVTDNG